MLLPGVESLEIIESYPDDKYLPRLLLRSESEGTVFHVHLATDVDGGSVRVVTMYSPEPAEWDQGFEPGGHDCEMPCMWGFARAASN